MKRILRARALARCSFAVMMLTASAGAQTWNDPRSRALVEQATARRAAQLADTGLTDYRADAHGYVTFLAQLGEGFPLPPKIVKADELASEVYWHAPGLSKQIIVGRRDTLLLPTDIQYHRDHLGIVQNNFPNIIRLGDGDEVADVPHPLSPAGLTQYDFAISDSLPIRFPGGQIKVYEVKVRPKDDRQARVIGAVYLDASSGQVVRMAFNFTRAAFLDKELEDLFVVLENHLVGTRFWLPSRQEIEIRRSGSWLDYPVRGIIRGRWEISNYRFNTQTPFSIYGGQEIVQLPKAQQQQHAWQGAILDALPPDVRAVVDPDIARIQAEARQLVRAQALARSRTTAISARGLSDFVRFNRVEGLALGQGVTQRFGNGFSAIVRARFGIDDHHLKGESRLSWEHPSGFGARVFGMHELREIGEVQERSTVINSIAAQEFASDYTDPFLVRAGGIGIDFPRFAAAKWSLEGAVERHDAVAVRARSVTGRFETTLPIPGARYTRLTLRADHAPALAPLGAEVEAHGELRALLPQESSRINTLHASFVAGVERPVGVQRLVLRTIAATGGRAEDEEGVYLGGPVSAPGYDFHTLAATSAVSQRVEWRMPVPFPSVSLGRFGRVPARATLAPYFVGSYVGGSIGCSSAPPSVGFSSCVRQRRFGPAGVYSSLGAGFLTPFDLVRADVARGLRGGGWMFSLDMSRELWSIF